MQLIGRIPITTIRSVVWDGSPYHTDAHVMCDYKNGQQLYEKITYKEVIKGQEMRELDTSKFIGINPDITRT